MSAEHDQALAEAQQPIQIVQTGEAPGDLGMATHVLHPFAQGPAPHRHTAHRELCYVLEGVLAARHADVIVVLHAGELLNTTAGIEHAYWNPAAAPTRLLLIYVPGAPANVLQHLARGEVPPGAGP